MQPNAFMGSRNAQALQIVSPMNGIPTIKNTEYGIGVLSMFVVSVFGSDISLDGTFRTYISSYFRFH